MYLYTSTHVTSIAVAYRPVLLWYSESLGTGAPGSRGKTSHKMYRTDGRPRPGVETISASGVPPSHKSIRPAKTSKSKHPSVPHFPRHKSAEMPFQIINWLFATEPCLAGVPWKNWIAARDKSDGNLSYLIRPLPDARHRTRGPIIIFWPRTFKGDRSCPSATYAPLCRATSYKQCVSIRLQNGLLAGGRHYGRRPG